MKTTWLKESEIERKWYIIDADGIILGRLATVVASRLIGKSKVNRVPNMDCGDYVIILNAPKFRVSGKKLSDKMYYRHSGYPGNLKERSLDEMIKNGDSEKVIRKAVNNMLPNSKLRSRMMSRLYIYETNQNPHEAQKPEMVKII